MARWIDGGGRFSAGIRRSSEASTARRSSSKNCGSFIVTEGMRESLVAGKSRFALVLGIERLGGEFAVRFLQQNLHAALGFLELLLTLPRKRHAFFKELHGIVERELRALETANNFLEPRERALKVRLLRRVGLFGSGSIHVIALSPQILFLTARAVVSGPPALRDPPYQLAATAATFSFAAIDAKNFIQALEPPCRVAKIGRRMQTAF